MYGFIILCEITLIDLSKYEYKTVFVIVSSMTCEINIVGADIKPNACHDMSQQVLLLLPLVRCKSNFGYHDTFIG